MVGVQIDYKEWECQLNTFIFERGLTCHLKITKLRWKTLVMLATEIMIRQQ